jgi:serine/threonine protein kinase
MKQRDIFIEALQKEDAGQRAAFLQATCGDDDQLRQSVEELLAEHEKDASFFLDSPPRGADETVEIAPITEKPGTRIGPYKLLQQIGEGGMGVVYMAEQSEPVKRRVALKIIKPGMDTRQVIARFEAERQALAMMDHPNIARVLDAGATESGRPYFVMELVNGISVTQYCDERHLTPRQRLELFLPICQAVQHAHQKGIIHRDLKPSNVLIALYDDQAVPKVIDFGVAKATSQTLTEKTMFTQLGQVLGTMEYMSPEQAQRNQLDIDTRSDIYSLGVVLYELLTGDTPFDRQRLRSAAFEEMLRIIREEEPSKPSTKVSTSARAPSIAANRSIDAEKLGSMIRGELDWIVMKALEKDRSRRYATASNFAEDVQRYLNDEAVEACPPSAQYRFRKFARRNRSALVTASIAAAALITLTIVTALAAARFRDLANYNADLVAQKETSLHAETDAKNSARRAQDDAEDALGDARRQRGRAEDNLVRARAAVDEFLNQVTDNELLSVPGLQPLRRDLLISALDFYQEFAAEKADDPALQVELAGASYRIGRIQRELGQTEASDASITDAVKRYTILRDQGIDTMEVQTGPCPLLSAPL